MTASRQPNTSFHSIDLQPLSKIRSERGLIFSLYMDLRSTKKEDLPARFQNLLRQPEHQKKFDRETPDNQKQWKQDAERVRHFLENEQPFQGKGLAIFSSLASGLWETYILPVPFFEHLVTRDRPFVRPIEILNAEFKAQANESGGDQEQLIEAQRVKGLLERVQSGGAAVLGVEQTLLAVKEMRANLLVVEEDFHHAGGECPNCGYLGTGEQDNCPLCGVALRREPDIIEAALKRVLDQGGEIEILRSPQSRNALAPYGRIGALMKDSGSPGEVNSNATRDEIIEQSFPASDPPGSSQQSDS